MAGLLTRAEWTASCWPGANEQGRGCFRHGCALFVGPGQGEVAAGEPGRSPGWSGQRLLEVHPRSRQGRTPAPPAAGSAGAAPVHGWPPGQAGGPGRRGSGQAVRRRGGSVRPPPPGNTASRRCGRPCRWPPADGSSRNMVLVRSGKRNKIHSGFVAGGHRWPAARPRGGEPEQGPQAEPVVPVGALCRQPPRRMAAPCLRAGAGGNPGPPPGGTAGR